MTGIDYIWMFSIVTFSIVMAIWWWRIANKWQATSAMWRERYSEVLDLGEQVQKIAEDRQKDVDLLRKICNAWQVMAPMATSEALKTREQGIAYLGKLP